MLFDPETNSVLEELEKTQKEFWNISRQSGVLLNMLIKMNNFKSALEIGTSNGYSGIWISKAIKENDGKLTTIEYFDKRQSPAIENFKKCGVIDVIRPLQGMACAVIESFSESEKFDFVFIDANKSEYEKYFELIKPHLTEKALIAADNITTHPDKVRGFVDKISSDTDFQTVLLDIPGGMLISYKSMNR